MMTLAAHNGFLYSPVGHGERSMTEIASRTEGILSPRRT
jgi:hypothetical protein